jgi:hypothetical protein
LIRRAIELAVAGALLWEIRYFERDSAGELDQLPDARLQLLFALVLGATLFGSLWAIAEEGEALAASLVTVRVAVSLLPVLIPRAATADQRRTYERTRCRLRRRRRRVFLYVLVVGGVIALINID